MNSRAVLLTLAYIGLPVASVPVFAQNAPKQVAPSPTPAKPAAAKPTAASAALNWNWLDDDAEDAGYDVSGQLTTLPAQMALNRDEDGNGYVVKLDGKVLSLEITQKGKTSTLATAPTKITLPATFVAQRRGPRWRFIINGQTTLEAENDAFLEGKVGTVGGFSEVRLQPVENINFDDDFMRVASDVAMRDAIANPRAGVRIRDAAITESIWSSLSGKWGTTGLTENAEAQVAQSANPFAFRALAQGENLAIAGRPFWSDYTAQISAFPEGADAIGLLVNAQDAKNYLEFYWSVKGDPQLRAVINGQMRVLASAKGFGPYEPKQWVRLGLATSSGTLRAFVDDQEIMRASTGAFARGSIGLWANLPQPGDDKAGIGVVFDDAQVRSINDFYDPFRAPVAGRWQNISGDWKLGNGKAASVGTRGAYAVMGEKEWTGYQVSGRLDVPQNGAAGLVLNHQAGVGAYVVRVGGPKSPVAANKIQLVKISAGKTQILAEVPNTKSIAAATPWTFSDERGYLSVKRGDTRVIDAFDATLKNGRAGIYAQNGAATGTAGVENFSVEWPNVRSTWAKVPALYEVEQQAETMGSWSTPQGFWVAKKDADNTVLEHKGRFFGAETVKFPLPDLTGDKTARLQFGSDAAIVLTPQLVRIEKAGKTVGEEKIALAKGTPVEIERRGSFVIVRTGDNTPLAARV